jgi:peptidoglycan/xylan/chitin deacetylase (PgdA/CDA1 family)
MALWPRLYGRYQRLCSSVPYKRPFLIRTDTAVISFSFDDFPRSALITGGAILKRFGLSATYYASLGLMGTQAPTGLMFSSDDVKTLLEDGHELGCHTFAHCHSWNTNTSLFTQSILENRIALNRLVPGASFRTFSYPISQPRIRTKRDVARHFTCCRCGGQTFNVGVADLNLLAAYFLEKSIDNPDAIKSLIDENRRRRGWLVFATHDVCDAPTKWGCTPDFFEDVVRYAAYSGARILPVAQALEALRGSAAGPID